jgi:hypothetical protein
MRKLGKSCVCWCFFVSFKIVNYGGRQGNTVQTLAQWRHLVALHEAMDALHWVMRPASHHRICMAIKIASIDVYFLLLSILLLATTIS